MKSFTKAAFAMKQGCRFAQWWQAGPVWRAASLFALALLAPLTAHATRQGEDQARAAIEHKLKMIIVPQVDFRQVPLRDAVEFLRQEVRRLDTADADPETRGVNIFVKLRGPTATTQPVNLSVAAGSSAPGLSANANGSPAAPLADPASESVMLSCSNCSALKILREVADQVGMKVKTEAYAVSLVPADEMTDALITAEFDVPPEILAALSASAPKTEGSADQPARFDARVWLKERGIASPSGASATYLPKVKKLVVRNTETNVDRIKVLLPLHDAGIKL